MLLYNAAKSGGLYIKYVSMLNENGIFATQIPLFEEMPANQCIIKAEKIFADKIKGIEEDKYILHSASEYYDMVAKCTNKIEMWITDYCHEMDNLLFPFKRLFLVGQK